MHDNIAHAVPRGKASDYTERAHEHALLVKLVQVFE